MKTIRTALYLIIVLSASVAKAQLTPLKNIQSPEIANLGLYGMIPVSHYT